MLEIGLIATLILILTTVASYSGFKDFAFSEKYKFQVQDILIERDYKRLITSGFLHVGWWHLGLNMITLYFFSGAIEIRYGMGIFALIYFGSLIGGNLFALFIHKNHYSYSAVGASGAISGIVFASIALIQGMGVGMLFIPISIPGWLFGLLYVSYSIYGIKSQRDNIGHEAHLGGGITGMLIALILYPDMIFVNSLPIALVLIPSLLFLYFLLTKPEFLILKNPFRKSKGVETFEDKYNATKKEKEAELDRLLFKIKKKGLASLSKEERDRLNKLSN